jgi:xanthine dehydrogenase small subunit
VIERRWVVNGATERVRTEPLRPLLHVLRAELGLIGAKEGCGEGECGACTLLLDGRPVTACLVPAGQVLDGSRILTIEGISETPFGRIILDAFVEHGAVQCGICIPGMVVTAYAFLRDNPTPTENEVREAISGNLCRCTGYAKIVSAILSAGEQAARHGVGVTAEPGAADPARPTPREGAAPSDSPSLLTPRTLAEAVALRAREPGCTVLAGGTDLMVGWNAAPTPTASHLLSLEGVEELRGIREEGGALRIGATTRVEQLARDPLAARLTPGLVQSAQRLGARGIRERATIGGNIANASPAADLVPPLVAADASLVLASRAGRREVAITDFYRGYKQLDLRPDEILIEVRCPALTDGAREGFRKLGTRRAQSIAKVSAAMRLRLNEGRIQEIAIAAGSVAPTVVRLPRTEERLRGLRLSPDLPSRARPWAAREVTPISDVRSTADYRRAMTGVLVGELLQELGWARPAP